MCEHHYKSQYILCSQCDILVVIPDLPHGYKAFCPRCNIVLKIQWNKPQQRLTFYSLAALFMLLLSNLFPLITLKTAGITNEINLLKISYIMFSEHYISIGIFFILFVQIIPAFCFIIILFLVNYHRMKITIPIAILLARMLFQLKDWKMAEIFLIGILVSLFKLISYGDIYIGSSFVPYCLYCILQFQTFQVIDKNWIWENIISSPIPTKTFFVGVPGILQGIRSCSCCTAILPSEQERCPRCGTYGFSRRKNSLKWTLILLIIAAIFYSFANILPVIVTDSLGNKVSSTIIAGIILMWKEGSYLIAIIAFIASIMLPILKMIIIIFLCSYAKGYGKYSEKNINLIYVIMKYIGYWSMIDIFIIAILTALVHIDGLVNVHPDIGVIMFSLVVILIMFASMIFDPRLLWDRKH